MISTVHPQDGKPVLAIPERRALSYDASLARFKILPRCSARDSFQYFSDMRTPNHQCIKIAQLSPKARHVPISRPTFIFSNCGIHNYARYSYVVALCIAITHDNDCVGLDEVPVYHTYVPWASHTYTTVMYIIL